MAAAPYFPLSANSRQDRVLVHEVKEPFFQPTNTMWVGANRGLSDVLHQRFDCLAEAIKSPKYKFLLT